MKDMLLKILLTALPTTEETDVFFVRSIQGEYQLNSIVMLTPENRLTLSLSSSTAKLDKFTPHSKRQMDFLYK
jgi:hypothetical protein